MRAAKPWYTAYTAGESEGTHESREAWGAVWSLVFWWSPRCWEASTVRPCARPPRALPICRTRSRTSPASSRSCRQNYAIPVDTDHALYDGAIPGMLRVLDPHSTFFDPRQYALLREDQRGKYYGVGMTVGPQDNHTVVLAPMPGSPAVESGHSPRRHHRRRGRQVHRRADHLGSRRPAERAQGHGRARHHGARRLRRSRSLSPSRATKFPSTPWTSPLMCGPASATCSSPAFNEDTDTELAAALKQLDCDQPRGTGSRSARQSRRPAE